MKRRENRNNSGPAPGPVPGPGPGQSIEDLMKHVPPNVTMKPGE